MQLREFRGWKISGKDEFLMLQRYQTLTLHGKQLESNASKKLRNKYFNYYCLYFHP